MGQGLRKATASTRAPYKAHGQEHVFRFLDKGALSAKEEHEFVKQLEAIDVARAVELFKGSTADKADEADESVTPIDPSEVASVADAKEHDAEWSELAYEAMSKGKVAFVVLSGGQGTRLGFSRAKGMYDILLPSHKSLFQLQAERLRKLHELVAARFPENKSTTRIPWYIMTSPLNDADTRGYFKENKFFGLRKEDVFFFEQGTLPCMTPEGKFILENKAMVAFAPDGNGGIYLSMKNTGALDDMAKRGVEHLHVTSVDNALVQVADPAFVGYCLAKDAEVGNKGCPKVSWDEKVGVMARKGGKFSIVEYSELDEAMAKETSEDGRLLFSTGNICNHYFSVPFIRDRAIPALTECYHVAHKKIPYADDTTGETVKPTSNNGIKLELFIFDVFPLTDRMAVFECDRDMEFAPVKNAPGETSDSPDTARAMIGSLHRGWLNAAEIEVTGDADAVCEITPLVSLRGEGLDKLAPVLKEVKAPALVCRAGEVEPQGATNVMSADDVEVTHFVNAADVNVYVVAHTAK